MVGMKETYALLCVLLFNFAQIKSSEVSRSTGRFALDSCLTSCLQKYPAGNEVTKRPREACHFGCEQFSRLDLIVGKIQTGRTQDFCLDRCKFTFTFPKHRFACNRGCTATLPFKQIGSFEISRQFVSDDAEPDDVMLDPALRAQVSPGFDMSNHIPEMHIKTLPVSHTWEMTGNGHVVEYYPIPPVQSSTPPYTFTDWLDCVGLKSGLARFSLTGMVLLVILCSLWICFIPEQSQNLVSTSLLEDNCHVFESEMPSSPPPKYSEIAEVA